MPVFWPRKHLLIHVGQFTPFSFCLRLAYEINVDQMCIFAKVVRLNNDTVAFSCQRS